MNSKYQKPKSRLCRLHGFSLIELLVVIAIVLILMVIAFPVMKRLSERRQEMICMNNLRRLGGIVTLYITDHNGLLESFHGGTVSSNMWSTEVLRAGYVDPNYPTDPIKEMMLAFINSPAASLFRCPTGKVPANYNLPSGWGLWLWATYGLAMHSPEGEIGPSVLDPTGKTKVYKVRMANISEPGKYILLADSANNATDFYQSFRISRSAGAGGFALRHQNRANAVFLDGHVESLTRDGLLELGVPSEIIFKH